MSTTLLGIERENDRLSYKLKRVSTRLTNRQKDPKSSNFSYGIFDEGNKLLSVKS